MCLARYILGATEAWPETLKRLTIIEKADFEECMRELLSEVWSVGKRARAENVVKFFSTEMVNRGVTSTKY